MSEVEVVKLGVRFDPAALVMTYKDEFGLSTRRRTIPIRNLSKDSVIDEIATDLRQIKHHKKYLSNISQLQLMRMLMLIKDHLNGLTLEESLEKGRKLDDIDPNEDLNKADQETLSRKKAAMEEMFVQNQKKSTDPDFQYDIQVDFSNDAVETLNWSDDDDDDFGF